MVSRCNAGLNVGCHIADPVFPFGGRLGETHAVFPGGDFDGPVAAVTLLNNRVTTASIELASCLVHKGALKPLPYSCTNHGNHILSLEILKSEPFYPVSQNHRQSMLGEKLIKAEAYALR